MIFGREPVAWLNLVKAGLTLAIVFGLPVTQSQETAILGFAAILLVFAVGGIAERALVTPVKAPSLPSGTEVTVQPSGEKVTL